eukprot:7683492-Alexandrium_andersonii.AAC.1
MWANRRFRPMLRCRQWAKPSNGHSCTVEKQGTSVCGPCAGEGGASASAARLPASLSVVLPACFLECRSALKT